jgi:hypothetical protein
MKNRDSEWLSCSASVWSETRVLYEDAGVYASNRNESVL